MVVLVSVDDELVDGDSLDDISALKTSWDATFTTKDLKEIRFFLGLEICRQSNGFHINQWKFALDIFQEVGLTSGEPL